MEPRKPYGRRPVVAVSPKGEIVAYYESLTEASKDAKIDVSNLCQGVRQGLYRRKLRWMYEEDYREYWMAGKTDELAYNRREERNSHIAEALRNLSPEKKEQRRKSLSAACKKRYAENPGYHLHKVQENRRRKVRCSTTGEEFNSIKDFCLKYGASRGNAWACLNGRRNMVKGMKIEYINEGK